ncbi:aminopeptidase P family protein [Homoserinimonas sp. OAct 916]|uniref:aminopeptidase P family protein n=1 Tax=Homoserinimonas sp. OAct 916 TaxID=2211450 RepID=UPI001E64258F|nr:aminopeptidase P family protein [Homoserinimonas sp. OAct 916]
MNLDQPAASSMPKPARKDPRMPRLADSAEFNAYMSDGWTTPDRTPPVVAGAPEAAAAHRARLSAELPGQTIVLASGLAPTRANDTMYDFRPDSDFYWLTGCAAEEAVLVMTPAGSGHDATLYLPEPFYPGHPGFYSNARFGELWVGSAPSPADWATALQLDTRGSSVLAEVLGGLKSPMVAGNPNQTVQSVLGAADSTQLRRTLSELRLVKDAWEIAQLREAVDHTVSGFAATVREFSTAIAGAGERWLQGTFDRHARTHGNGVGYTTIVGSGRNAATLHWVRCDGPVLADHLVLLDMGVEVNSFYTADVTRTIPAAGTFSPLQRQVHDLVEKAHRAGMAAVAPGKQFSDFHTASMQVIAEGLKDWGLLKVSVDEALAPEGQQHRRYLVCGIGHHLGLDVHDCAKSHYDRYQGADLEPGMVLTVEPGLYFHEMDLTVPPELRGIGVRLEDDLLVTETGTDILSDALPIDATGIEAWFAEHTR